MILLKNKRERERASKKIKKDEPCFRFFAYFKMTIVRVETYFSFQFGKTVINLFSLEGKQDLKVVVVHTFNSSTWEAEAGGSESGQAGRQSKFQDSQDYRETLS